MHLCLSLSIKFPGMNVLQAAYNENRRILKKNKTMNCAYMHTQRLILDLKRMNKDLCSNLDNVCALFSGLK